MGKVITRKEKETKKKLPEKFKKIARALKDIERELILQEIKQAELEKQIKYG